MESITLGTSGVAVTPLCIGTWAWGDKLFWNYGKDYGIEQLQDAFNTALAAGITFFDTAEIYGMGLSEKILGEFAQKTDQTLQIATKYAPTPWRFKGEAVGDALTASLKRLQVEKVELYQVHWSFAFFMSQHTLMNALADAVEQGRITSVGVSNYSAEQMREAHQILAQRGVTLAVNQVNYSLLTRQIENNGVMDVAKELGVTILAYSPLAQGLLTGKYRQNAGVQPTGVRKLSPQFQPDGLRKIEPILNLLQQIGDKYGKSPAQVALNWLIAQGNVIPIAGAKTADQVRQNAGALGWQLSEDEVRELGSMRIN
ncbi:aldo/keto reductase [Calothrix sp. PCC 6303]|uniref:aldo/keto reductase n=1 Tax=Calothrix sp. PCC 6303 TaxID=1170562 RepID=UPI0002A05255|nr:aldo/keto reductase [Calothrix sp. PCC 6303]AFZ03545.1 NADP-dependent oxidoreductase domain protein [Calothrix sp. PCC 6303]